MTDSKQVEICQMFDDIAKTYDPVNRLLSFRQDVRWRKFVADQLKMQDGLSILDVATGTGDLLLTMCDKRPGFKKAVGVDLSAEMLSVGRDKIKHKGLSDRMSMQLADAASLPFADESFDVVTIAFGIRNVVKKEQAIKEISRVLDRKGQVFILEFSIPKNPVIKFFYLLYFRHILPMIGGIIAKNVRAYKYLNHTVEEFPTEQEFKSMMLKNGFLKVEATSLTFGVATVYSARRC